MSLPTGPARTEIAELLPRITGALEDLLLTGLSSATPVTRQTLAVSFKAASKLRLLRLGSTLRAVMEEIGRYNRDEDSFSRFRFSFFLNRAWMLCRGLGQALESQNQEQWDSLTVPPAQSKIERLEAVVVGVSKRVAPNAFCAFEFRLRPLPSGSVLSWAAIFPLKPGQSVPPEAFLQLPQKQKFKAVALLEGKTVCVSNALRNESGRLTLTESSQVSFGDSFKDWASLDEHDPAELLGRLESHQANPFALDVEFQEDVTLRDWSLGQLGEPDREGKRLLSLEVPGAQFHIPLRSEAHDEELLSRLREWGEHAEPPPLYGVLHFESLRMMLAPLAVLAPSGPDYLTISQDNMDPKKLLQALDFS